MLLREMIFKDMAKFTVIFTVLEVLNGHISAKKESTVFEGLTPAEIKAGYDKNAKKYNKNQFYHTYLQRHTKEGDYFIEVSVGRYSLRPELVEHISINELKSLQADILNYWNASSEPKQILMTDIQKLLNFDPSNLEVRRRFISEQLKLHLGNSGQNLEIMAYSILKVYFSALGFSLRRFSTTFANDGGMDFISSDAFYQVTASPSKAKISSDLSKLPGIKRVLIAPNFSADSDSYDRIGKWDNVLETIDLIDLDSHFLEWLFIKDKTRNRAYHLQSILEVAYEEYSRE